MKYKYLYNKSLLTDLAQSLTWSRRQRVLGAEVRHGADTALHQGPGAWGHCTVGSPGLKSNGKHGPGARTREVKCALDSVPRRWAGAAPCLTVITRDSWESLSKQSRFNLVFVSLFSFRGRNVFCNFQSVHARATNQTQGCSLLIIGNLCRDHGPSGQPVTLYWIIT